MDLVYALNAALGTEYDPRQSLTRIELSGSIYSQRPLIDRHRLTHKTTNLLFFTDSYHVVCDNGGFEKFSFGTRTIVTTEGACRVVLHFKDDESIPPSQEVFNVIGACPFRFIDHVAPLFLTHQDPEINTKLLRAPVAKLNRNYILVHTSGDFLKKDDEYERFAVLYMDLNENFQDASDRKEIIQNTLDAFLLEANKFWNLKALISTEGPAFDRLIKDILFPPDLGVNRK
jgi:hypothetical protein